MRTPKRWTWFAPATVSMLLVGCSLSRHAPAPQYYLITGASGPEPAASVAAYGGGVVVGLRPARLEGYLDSPFIVIRGASSRVGFSEFHRWGEDLGRAVNSVVAARLAAEAPTWLIEVAPWGVGARPDYLVQLHVLRFEGIAPDGVTEPGGEAHVNVTWQILRGEDGALLSRGGSEVRDPSWTPGDFDGLVRALDGGLATLAKALLADLERAVVLRD